MVWSRDREPAAEAESSRSESPPAVPGRRLATLGPSITVKGNLSGDEDLLIEGRVQGEISLRKGNVTIGPTGKVKADIYSKSICVEGEVKGNLYGSEEVTIRKSGKVEGNAVAPRVTLENGAKFRGNIDMQPQAEKEAAGADPDRSSRTSPSRDASKQKGRGRSEVAAAPQTSQMEKGRITS